MFFFISATNTFAHNVHSTKDNIYNLLILLQRSKDIGLLSSDEDSSLEILDKASYKEKLLCKNGTIHVSSVVYEGI